MFGFAANGFLDGLGRMEDVSPFQWLNGGLPPANGVQAGPVSIMAALVIVPTSIGT